MTPATLVSTFLAYANKLKFRNLFFIVSALFISDLIIPDFIPLIDEIILGLLAIVLANWKEERRNPEKSGKIIEGEIVDEEPEQKP
jgi:hypothetical protein